MYLYTYSVIYIYIFTESDGYNVHLLRREGRGMRFT